MIKVIVNGARGKMGACTVEAIKASTDCEVVLACHRDHDLASEINRYNADVVVDFTVPDGLYERTKLIIDAGARPVIGTSGLSTKEIDSLSERCSARQLGGIIAPNFSISAILLMRFSAEAAKYLPDAEIIEMHHPMKIDAPSGTAKKTAEMMRSAIQNNVTNQSTDDQTARGERYLGIPIHAVRIPGVVAKQTVILGGHDETLSIEQNSLSRASFMPGVLLSCRKVMHLNHMVYGLETIL